MAADINLLKNVQGIVDSFDTNKEAYAAPGANAMTPEAMAPPPMDPAMMGGAPPPMDPSMMGGAPMPPPPMPMDPSMMGGAPMPPMPMDPAMMGMAPPMPPPMPMDPSMMGGMPPVDPAMIAAMMGGGMPPVEPPAEASVEEEAPAEEEKDNVEESDVEARLGVLEDMMAALLESQGLPVPEGAAPAPEEAPPTELPPIPGMVGDAAIDAEDPNAMTMPPDFDLAGNLKQAALKQQQKQAQQESSRVLADKLAMLKKYT
jgi:hypothetical protein